MQSITLQTNDSVISSGDALGQVQFAASAESDGGASRLIGAKIYAQGEGAFNASSNPTSIIFATSAADNLPASGKIKIDDNGNIIPLLTQNYNLGSSSSEFANIYVSDSIYVSGIALIDGSNYTIGADTYSLASGVIVDGGSAPIPNVDLYLRRDSDTTWESTNPILASGEPGWDITNRILKVGNGVDAWNDLQGIGGGANFDLSYSRGFFLLNEPSGTFTVDGGYTVGHLDVYMNGVKLFPSGDYTATNGNNFTLNETAPSGTLIEYLVPNIGSQGVQGIQGVQGAQGIQGVQGLDGLFAAQGIQGIHGIQGVQGVQGTQGTQGLQGVQGIQGIQGLDGLFAAQGIQGTQGTQGLNSAIVSTGVPSNPYDGLRWFNSENGKEYIYYDSFWVQTGSSFTGERGLQGVQGIQGVQGVQGTQGTQGLQGVDGFINTVVSTGVPTSPTEGMRWFNTTNGKEYVYYDSFWVQTGSSFTGERGLQGVQGIQGVQGVQGTQGTQGLQGVDGFINTVVSTGVPTSPTEGMRWFNTTNGKEYVYYDSFWVQTGSSFTGERGLQGVQGIQGVQGVQGTQGVQGIQGVEGFINTVVSTGVPTSPTEGMRWFNSTSGKEYVYYDSFWVQTGSSFTGERGLQGIQGVQGVQGVQGLNGLFAAQGIQGTQGTQGLTGSGVLGSGVADYVAYWTSSEEISYDSSLYWDSTNDRMGIGTTPEETLHIDGNILSNKLYLEKLSSPSISSSTLTLDLDNSQLFLVSLNSDITTLNINNTPATSGVAVGFSIIFTADGTARSVTWPASVKWPSASAPTLTSTNGKKDVLSFVSPDNGTSWLGFVGGQNF